MGKSLQIGLILFWMASSVWASGPEERGVLRIKCPDGASGTAFVIDQRDSDTKVFATAWHVVQYRVNGQDAAGNLMFPGVDPYLIETQSGKEITKARIAVVDTINDMALLVGKTSEKFDHHKLHDSFVCPDPTTSYSGKAKEVKFQGYANGSFLETQGTLGIREKLTIFSDAVLVPGMSGGPMLLDDKVVGIVSGGMKWFDGDGTKLTWPARCGSVERIKELLKFVK